MNEATKIMIKLNDKFQKIIYLGGKIALDNEDVISSISDEAESIKDILGQQTFIMSDSSYITRNDDSYWSDDDVGEFELTEIMENEKSRARDLK